MLEKEIEQYFCKAVKTQLSGWPLKFTSPGQNGMPDRIVLLPGGKIYFVELKAPRQKGTKAAGACASGVEHSRFSGAAD